MTDNVTEVDGSTTTSAEAPEHWPAKPLALYKAEWPGIRCHVFNMSKAWTTPVVNEWELEAAGWQDFHQHDELNYIIEGELHVECNGHETIVGQGGLARVPAGSTGRYWAPKYARMISIYGPNPDGTPIDKTKYWDVEPATNS